MSVTALVSGKLLSDPEQRTGASGKPFTTARVAADAEGDSVLCSVIAFGTAAGQLAALAKGDTLALTGRCKPKAWSTKDGELKTGLDVVADALLSAYHVKRRRAAMGPQGAEEAAGDRRRCAEDFDFHGAAEDGRR